MRKIAAPHLFLLAAIVRTITTLCVSAALILLPVLISAAIGVNAIVASNPRTQWTPQFAAASSGVHSIPPMGPLTNGANHSGTIQSGSVDTWTITAAFNDSINLSLGEVLANGPDPGFTPRLQLLDPNGVTLDDNNGTSAIEIILRAPIAGTYTVLVSNRFPASQTGPGNYTLTVAKTPGPYTISPGDEGGPMTNGANHSGVIGIGDQDTWTFEATFNQSINISLGEVLRDGPNPAFNPRLRLVRPDGLTADDNSGTNAIEIILRAPITGTYTVIVSNRHPNSQIGSVNYTLTLARSPGPYIVSPDDEGGPMTNGSNHSGVIGVSDQDIWTFDATFNQSINLSIGEVLRDGPNPAFNPRLRLVRPDGLTADDNSGTNAIEIILRAPITGTYTVIVSNRHPDSQIGSVNYTLTLAGTPGPYIISPGDEGRQFANGANHAGVIGIGDQDTWIFRAAANNSINLNLSEVLVGGPDPGFNPRLRLLRPDGATHVDTSGTNIAQIITQVPLTGIYTVIVSNRHPDSQDGPVSYRLSLAGPPQPTLTDFDADGRADLSVYRPSDNIWYLLRGTAGYTSMGFGVTGDLITPADYDNDGKTDVAVFRPSNGIWFFFNSATQSFSTAAWGQNGDIPAPADHDGDGSADLVVFRPSTGTWFTRFSSNSSFSTVGFGVAGDRPVIGDFDGDGKADIGVFRPSDNNWYVLRTTTGFSIHTWGQSGDIPAPADYDGDGSTDLVIFRPSTGQWFRNMSTAGIDARSWGQNLDKPVAADYDGDGKADIAVFRPSTGTWFIVGSGSGIIQSVFGTSEDLPTPNAFNQ